MFIDSELGDCQVTILERQDVGDDVMIGQEMQNEDYDLRNQSLSEDNDGQDTQKVDQGMLR